MRGDSQLHARISGDTLIHYMSVLGLINYRILDATEEAFHIQSLMAEHDRLVEKLNAFTKRRKVSLREHQAAIRLDKRLGKVRAELDRFMEKEKVKENA